jgi:hypothetical protein
MIRCEQPQTWRLFVSMVNISVRQLEESDCEIDVRPS